MRIETEREKKTDTGTKTDIERRIWTAETERKNGREIKTDIATETNVIKTETGGKTKIETENTAKGLGK